MVLGRGSSTRGSPAAGVHFVRAGHETWSSGAVTSTGVVISL